MKEELFDVVNERDEVVEQRPRAEVHRLGLRHRAVHVLVFSAAGKIFLQRRSLRKDCSPGLWDSSASGHLEAGETYDACAVRELAEELGLTGLRPGPRAMFKLEAGADTGMEFVWVYRVESEGPFQLQAEEIEEGRWESPWAVTEWTRTRPQEFATSFLRIWTELRQRGVVGDQAPGLPGRSGR